MSLSDSELRLLRGPYDADHDDVLRIGAEVKRTHFSEGQTRARSRAAVTENRKDAELLLECATEIDRLRHFEVAHKSRCVLCNGTGRRYPYALPTTLAYGHRCSSCGGSGVA